MVTRVSDDTLTRLSDDMLTGPKRRWSDEGWSWWPGVIYHGPTLLIT